jgi:luciferase family oxidoreductase group 1
VKLTLSVLDFVPIRTDQTSADALAASRKLAKVADETGYERFWVAEHHASPFVSTNPPVLVSMLAADTTRIKVGSGGVMLPNHTAFDVAEQFALLEASFPGRIDLGLGRAPGGEAAVIYALRNGIGGDASRFPEEIENITMMLRPQGAVLRLNGRSFPLTATPRASTMPAIWILGSSTNSAKLAADAGLPYVYAHHFFGTGTAQALDVYRSRFRPSEHLAEPRVIVTMNAIVAGTREEARRLALPYMHMMLALQTGKRMSPQLLVEEAEAIAIPREHEPIVEQILAPWVIGDGPASRADVAAFAGLHGVDEIMIHPIAGAFTGTAPGQSPARETALRLLAALPRWFVWRPAIRAAAEVAAPVTLRNCPNERLRLK